MLMLSISFCILLELALRISSTTWPYLSSVKDAELVVPTPLLSQPDRQGFSYANPADRNRSPNAELSNHNFKVNCASTIELETCFLL